MQSPFSSKYLAVVLGDVLFGIGLIGTGLIGTVLITNSSLAGEAQAQPSASSNYQERLTNTENRARLSTQAPNRTPTSISARKTYVSSSGLQKRITQHNCTIRSSLVPRARRTLESRTKIQVYDVLPYVESVRCQKRIPVGYVAIPADLVSLFSAKVDASVVQYSRLVAPGLIEYVNRAS